VVLCPRGLRRGVIQSVVALEESLACRLLEFLHSRFTMKSGVIVFPDQTAITMLSGPPSKCRHVNAG
jgi:hypothetical protein